MILKNTFFASVKFLPSFRLKSSLIMIICTLQEYSSNINPSGSKVFAIQKILLSVFRILPNGAKFFGFSDQISREFGNSLIGGNVLFRSKVDRKI